MGQGQFAAKKQGKSETMYNKGMLMLSDDNFNKDDESYSCEEDDLMKALEGIDRLRVINKDKEKKIIMYKENTLV